MGATARNSSVSSVLQVRRGSMWRTSACGKSGRSSLPTLSTSTLVFPERSSSLPSAVISGSLRMISRKRS
jgi:hypothetical protein